MIWLTETHAQTIRDHALRDAPHEACGLIGGQGLQAQMVVPVANIATTPHDNFYMDPVAMVKALRVFDQQGLTLIGIYHSHPQSAPIPSPVDIQQAHYPDLTHIIAGVQPGCVELAAWRIQGQQVDRVELHIGAEPPPEQLNDASLSMAQKSAILLSAALACLLLIVISVTLLPPAPPIP